MADPACRFVEGETLVRCDYTPSGADVAAGDVVVVGKLVGIAHRTIKDGELGSLALANGIYEAVAIEDAIAMGDEVFWATNSNGEGLATSAGDYLGIAVTDGDIGDTVRFVKLLPTPTGV